MGIGTSIEWTDHSWPVVNGCRRVSAGCENCYAERLTATRLSKTPKYQGLAIMGKSGPRWTGETRLWALHLDMPLRLKKPSRIFVADMGDLFYEHVESDTIAAIFGIMAACPQHTFQVLTKRPKRMLEWYRWLDAYRPMHQLEVIGAMARNYLGAVEEPGGGWPLPNVWLGVSVEDQGTADERIPLLLDTPAAVRFVSYEPALGPVEFNPAVLGCRHALAATFTNPLVNWIIVGGESGPGSRPFDLEWARSTVRQCRDAEIACFVKQLGARPICNPEPTGNFRTDENTGKRQFEMKADQVILRDRKGGDMQEWPEDLRVRQFPGDPGDGGET